MGSGGMGPCLAVEGGTTKAVFEAYVERILAPSLSPGQQFVVLDNSRPTRATGRASLSKKGEREAAVLALLLARLLDDGGGIRQAQGAALRRERARTKEALLRAIGRALEAITPEDAKGWFDHCVYAVAQSL